MPSARAYDAVMSGAQHHFEIEFVFGPNTNLSSIAGQTDGEFLEWLLEDLGQAFAMRTPSVVDEQGRTRVPQLRVPEMLTVTQLADILDAGAWPSDWIWPGRYVR